MKKTLFIATILSLIVPVHADTATEMNQKLDAYIQKCNYEKGDDFILTFKIANTVVLQNKEYATSVLAIGDDAVWGTWTKSSLRGDGFILCDPQGTNPNSIIRSDGSSSGNTITFNEDYSVITDPSSATHSVLWVTSDEISPFVPDNGTQTSVAGWRIKNSTVTLTYDSKTDKASLSTVIYQMDAQGKQVGEAKTITLVLSNTEADANLLHFVTSEDVTSGDWKSPFKSSTATDFYQVLDSKDRSWLSGLVFVNLPADSYIKTDDDNHLTDKDSGSGSGVGVIAPEGDNTLDGPTLESKTDDVIILAPEGDNKLDNTTINSAQDIIIIGENNDVENSDLDAIRDILVDADENNTIAGTDMDAGRDIKLEADENNDVDDSALNAGQDIIIIGKDNDVTDSDLDAIRDILVDASGDNTLDGNDMDAGRDIKLEADGTNSVADTDLGAGQDIIIIGKENEVTDGSELVAKRDILVKAEDDNTIDGSTLDAGRDIALEAGGTNDIADSTLKAKDDIDIKGDENKLDGAVLDAGDTITLDGANEIAGGSKLDADHIVIKDDNDIHDADIHANKSVTILTGDEPGKSTTIGDNTSITSGDISISGASPDNQADISGTGTTIAAKKEKGTNGDIILDNVHVHDLEKPIEADGGSIILRNTDDIENATLAIKDPVTAPGSILADKGAVANIGEGVKLDGRLASADNTAVLNKKGGDDLLINFDDTAFNGTLNMANPDPNKGRLIVTNEFVPEKGSTGVGAGSHTNLNGHAMLVDNVRPGQENKPMEASLGNLNATGSKVEINPGVAGDRMQLSSLTLGSGSLLYVDVDPVNKVADCLSISGDLYNDGNPFLHVNNLTDPDKAEDGTRLTVLEVQGDMTGMTRDVICENGPKELNMYMEYVGNLGQLVYSSNFRTVSGGPNQNAAQKVTVAMMDSAARPDGQLGEVLQALRHTRSSGDTLAALQALSAASNLVVPHMVMDSSRHHISNLRRYMDAPLCPGENFQGTPLYAAGKRHAAWATYTGGHDHLNGDNALDAYNRNYQGAMVGYTAGVGYGCRNAVGASVGYESATGTVTGTKVKDNAIYLDLYAVTRFKRYTHRLNAGLGFHNFKVSRDVAVAAGGFSYAGRSNSTAHATSLNLGYELSRDCHYSPYTTYTPFAAVNVSVHTLGSATESGQANASVNTDYSDPVQVDLSAGVQWSRVTSSFSHNLPGKVYAALAVHAEVGDSRLTAQNKFQGFAEEWKTRSQKRDTLYGELSGGAVLPFNERWSSRAGVDFEFGADRLSIGGHVGVTYSF